MRVYLAGRMSGMPDLNFPAFKMWREKFRADGHIVFCPAEMSVKAGWEISPALNDDVNFRREVFGINLAWICSEAEAIALIAGWENSDGAKAEFYVAAALKLEIIYLPESV